MGMALLSLKMGPDILAVSCREKGVATESTLIRRGRSMKANG